jgi:hypothetical protein
MSRYRDNKGIFIAPKISEKLEKQTTKKTPPYTNSSKIRAGKFSEERAQRKQLQQQQKALDLKPLFRLKT